MRIWFEASCGLRTPVADLRECADGAHPEDALQPPLAVSMGATAMSCFVAIEFQPR